MQHPPSDTVHEQQWDSTKRMHGANQTVTAGGAGSDMVVK